MNVPKIEKWKGLVCFPVKVITGASRNQVVGVKEEVLVVKIQAEPQKGAANKALVSFLAELLKIKKRDLEIIRGETSHHKLIGIRDIEDSVLESRLGALIKD